MLGLVNFYNYTSILQHIQEINSWSAYKYYKILRLDNISLIISNKLINKEDINYYDMGVNSVRINLIIKTINW